MKVPGVLPSATTSTERFDPQDPCDHPPMAAATEAKNSVPLRPPRSKGSIRKRQTPPPRPSPPNITSGLPHQAINHQKPLATGTESGPPTATGIPPTSQLSYTYNPEYTLGYPQMTPFPTQPTTPYHTSGEQFSNHLTSQYLPTPSSSPHQVPYQHQTLATNASGLLPTSQPSYPCHPGYALGFPQQTSYQTQPMPYPSYGFVLGVPSPGNPPQPPLPSGFNPHAQAYPQQTLPQYGQDHTTLTHGGYPSQPYQ
jgi:hypothetical protein